MENISKFKTFVVVPSAGSGARMGSGTPKVFLDLLGRGVLERTLAAIKKGLPGAYIVVAGRPEFRGLYDRASESADAPFAFVSGGAERQESVRFCLEFIEREFSPAAEDIVVIHDAARCLASPELFRGAVEAGRRYGAATSAVPVVDTLLLGDENLFGIRNIDRAGLWAVQTPQAFFWSIISGAHRGAAAGATDDASLAAQFCKVRIFPGERTNIKLTSPEDMDLAARLLRSQPGDF